MCNNSKGERGYYRYETARHYHLDTRICGGWSWFVRGKMGWMRCSSCSNLDYRFLINKNRCGQMLHVVNGQTVPSLVIMNHSCPLSYFFHTPFLPCAVTTTYCLTIREDISDVTLAPSLPVSPLEPQTQALTPSNPGGLTPSTVK